jgi:hypothetical protein
MIREAALLSAMSNGYAVDVSCFRGEGALVVNISKARATFKHAADWV